MMEYHIRTCHEIKSTWWNDENENNKYVEEEQISINTMARKCQEDEIIVIRIAVTAVK